MNIVFLDRATVGPTINFPTPGFNHQWVEYAQTSACDTASRLQNADIAITNKVVIDEAVLKSCPRLKYVAVAATGMNNIDTVACRKRNITVANVTDYATQGVAEHVFMLILALSKQLKAYSRALQKDQWQAAGQFCFFLESSLGIQTLTGKTLGLIGTGNIARATAKIAKAFAMQVIYHSPSGRADVDGEACLKLDQLLQIADVVSIHCPLTENTRYLINRQTLGMMKPNAILIHTARGAIVDFDALVYAVNHNQIAGAGIDVLEEEPPLSNSTAMQALTNTKLIITPHIAWASQSAMQAMANQLMAKMDSFVSSAGT